MEDVWKIRFSFGSVAPWFLSRMFIPQQDVYSLLLIFFGLWPPECYIAYCFFFLIFYLPESLLRVYIWVRKYRLAVPAGFIVMIVAHRVAKQSWRFWSKIAAVRRIFRRHPPLQFMTLNIGDVSGDLRKLENVLSNVSCIKCEWQFRRLGRQYC